MQLKVLDTRPLSIKQRYKQALKYNHICKHQCLVVNNIIARLCTFLIWKIQSSAQCLPTEMNSEVQYTVLKGFCNPACNLVVNTADSMQEVHVNALLHSFSE